jgi:hypothetical protein
MLNTLIGSCYLLQWITWDITETLGLSEMNSHSSEMQLPGRLNARVEKMLELILEGK